MYQRLESCKTRPRNDVRDLTSRFLMDKAPVVVVVVYRLHSARWLHKPIRSDIILFSKSDERDKHPLAAPFIHGFDFPRRDTPLETTENVPMVMNIEPVYNPRTVLTSSS